MRQLFCARLNSRVKSNIDIVGPAKGILGVDYSTNVRSAKSTALPGDSLGAAQLYVAGQITGAHPWHHSISGESNFSTPWALRRDKSQADTSPVHFQMSGEGGKDAMDDCQMSVKNEEEASATASEGGDAVVPSVGLLPLPSTLAPPPTSLPPESSAVLKLLNTFLRKLLCPIYKSHARLLRMACSDIRYLQSYSI